MRILGLSLTFCLLFVPQIIAQTLISLSFDSGSFSLYENDGSTLLNDGDVVQFGYYTLATAEDPFAGSWVPLTGDGSANPSIATSINGAGFGPEFAGQFYWSGISLSATVPNGQIMAIRFYDSSNVASSTHFGAVASADAVQGMLWPGPGNTIAFQAGNTGTSWQGGNVGKTGLAAVPEPSAAFLILTFGGMLLNRRRISEGR